MKSYTDLNQSKKLAEFLPLESADMGWNVFVDDSTRCLPIDDWDLSKNGEGGAEFIPCWSLAALLDILAKETHNIDEDGHVVLSSYKGNWWNVSPINCVSGEIKESNNPLDAVFEMVCYLLEHNKI